jgi:FG-GAP-like repeat
MSPAPAISTATASPTSSGGTPISGQLVIWLLDATAGVIGGGSPGSAAPPWQPFGTGDFNGDGFDDILWRNTSTGQVVVWFVNGTSVIGGGSPGGAVSPWAIAETGDFNFDGKSDILWVNNTTGQLVVWLLEGASVIDGGSLGGAVSPWVIQGQNAD